MEKYKTLTILDWDDTLFPTSWIVKNGIDLNDSNKQNKYMVYFSRLDTLLYELLNKLLKHGKVYIITNAVIKWIVVSSSIIPNTQNLIRNNIVILSARDVYQSQYPDQLHMWKKKMFEKTVNEYYLDYVLQNIISVGDADYEFNATVDLYNSHSVLKYRLLKTIRFMKDPSFDDLIDQLEVFNNNVDKIVTNKKHFDLKFRDK